MATDMIAGRLVHLAHCDAAVSIVRGEMIATPVPTGEDLRKVEELQSQIKQGPYFDAVRHTGRSSART